MRGLGAAGRAYAAANVSSGACLALAARFVDAIADGRSTRLEVAA